MPREVSVELEVARTAYVAALDRWLADPHRHEIQSRSRLELGLASRRLISQLRADEDERKGRLPGRGGG